MNCPDYETLAALADGELETGRPLEIERHLAECANCRQFVEEMQWVDERGRAALGTIPVGEAPVTRTVWARACWRTQWRPISLAAAAAMAIALSVWTWLAKNSAGRHEAPHQIAPGSRAASGANRQVEESEDAAFEQWAAPYRKLQIPLVPMEVAANYSPPPVSPIQPNGIERNPK
jgi:anti-sigma factor RsiW